MGLVNNFETGKNFWKVNPQLQTIGIFKEFFDSDKTRDKDSSSKIMWGIALVYDVESRFYNLPEEDKKRFIATDYLKDPKFPWDAYKEHIDFFLLNCTTQAERSLIEWDSKMQERSEFIRDTKYTLGTVNSKGYYSGGTATVIDAMLANTKKLYDQYRQVLEDLMKEKGKGRTYGGASESATEKGLI